MRIYVLFATLIACMASCITKEAPPPPLATWEETMAVALQRAEARDYDFIINHMLAPECTAKLIVRYGEKGWKEKFKKDKLEKIPYYYRWLKERTVTTKENKTIVSGQYGCEAIFVNVNGRFLLGDFGQEITSM